MKTIPSGPQKRITYDPRAVEANKSRVRRHEPVFLVEVEEGDRLVTHRAHRVDIRGTTSTLYGTAAGFIRFVTTDEVVLDLDPAAAPEPTAPKKGTRNTNASKKDVTNG